MKKILNSKELLETNWIASEWFRLWLKLAYQTEYPKY